VIGEPKILGFLGYKAGMTHLIIVDSKKGSFTFGKEIVQAVTVLDTPPMIACALRAYEHTASGLKCLKDVWMEKPPHEIGRLVTLPETSNTEKLLGELAALSEKIVELRMLMATQPHLSATGNKTSELLEIKIGGGSIKAQLDYAKSLLGKEIKPPQVFRNGEIIDVVGITKGKGIQGPVKRWGIRRKAHKSRKTVRQVGSIGPWNPSYVVYTVPRAGQMGFHQRTEYSKQIVKIGEDGLEITPKSGFTNYGRVNGAYVMIKGSVPGPSKRAIKMRSASRAHDSQEPPKIEYISLQSKPSA
jgi:large subunit ribosomal protein L3